MSVCRSSRHLLRNANPSLPRQPSCTRLLPIRPTSRPFQTTSQLRKDSQDVAEPPKASDGQLSVKSNKSLPLRKRGDIVAAKRLADRMPEMTKIKQTFQPYEKDQIDVLSKHYTKEQMEALKAAEKAVDTDDLAVQWGDRTDQWRVRYLEDLAEVDPLVDKKVQIHVSDGPPSRLRTKEEAEHVLASSPLFNGLSLIEMLYLIEKRPLLPDKLKAGLRTLHQYKGTHKEFAAKRILWTFLPMDKGLRAIQEGINNEGQRTVDSLFEVLETLEMDDVKKHELLALKHWCGSPKEESLRPQLERLITEFAPHGMSKKTFEDIEYARLQNMLAKDFGRSGLDDELALVDVPHMDLWQREIYSAVQADIPKILDPRVTYDHATSEDAVNAAYMKLSRKLGVEMKYLKGMRVKMLVLHRVVNQTRQGKIQSMYALSVAGNGDGLIGIGEGKSVEVEDAMLQSRMNALRNLKPVHRYEQRTIYGKLNAKVGGTTVEIAARPPGKLFWTLSPCKSNCPGPNKMIQYRVRSSGAASHLRNLSLRGNSRHGGSSWPVSQQDERSQGYCASTPCSAVTG
jgi:small subunit ribosomal protein S5